MRKGIWQEFDGYQEIAEEIKVSQKLGGTVASAVASAQEYIRQLHPDRIQLSVSDIIAETSSTKTLSLFYLIRHSLLYLGSLIVRFLVEIAASVAGFATRKAWYDRAEGSQRTRRGYWPRSILHGQRRLSDQPLRVRIPSRV